MVAVAVLLSLSSTTARPSDPEGAGGASPDPKVTFKCVDIGDGKKECCFYKQP